MDIVKEYDQWLGRLSRPEDNERLCQILRDVEMQSDLHVTEWRDPDFFAIHQLHLGESYTLVVEDKTGVYTGTERIVCFCTAVIRDGWIDGVLKRTAYVCDLRMVKGYRRSRILPKACRDFFEYLEREKGVDAFYSVSLTDNKGAVAARRFSGGHVMSEFRMCNIQLIGRVKAPKNNVVIATSEDIPEISNFLDRQSRTRMFGYRFDNQELKKRLLVWPGLSINDFHIIKNRDGDVIACAAPWDASNGNLRKTRVDGYFGKMKLIRRAYNVEAFFRGFRKLPKVGVCFNQLSLTHLEIENDDPLLLEDIIKSVLRNSNKKELHFINLMLPKGSALEQGVEGFRSQSIDFDVNCFLPKKSPFHGQKFRTVRPGFEMAIH